ncbi:Hypothetical predicted protein [Podarcis lilfordi]|uniref:Uncharacterized protein n=1 Tax=Podarcis lilfordi TaxID=74358 RepID=A0AA35LK76_9SAUR|nr:Hypothetical predicted protein [Podarcis lilfordi]
MEEPSENRNVVQDLKEDLEEQDLAPSLPNGSLAHSSPETGIDLWIWVPYLAGPNWNSAPSQGLERCLRELPLNTPSQPWSPTASSSDSSSYVKRLHPWTMEEVEALSSAQEDMGSKVDWTLWQKGTEFRPWSTLLTPEEERGLPSTREPELVIMDSQASSASPLPIVERFLANIAMSQLLPSNIPPDDAKSPGDVVPRRSWQGMVGSHPTKAAADPSHQPVLESWKEEGAAQETAAKEKPLKGVLKRLKELINSHPPHIFRRNHNSSWQSALRQKMRKGTCGSPPGQVKLDAEDEELPAPSPENAAARGGSSCPVAPSDRSSTFQTERGRKRSWSEAEDRNIFAVFKMEEQFEDGNLVQHLNEAPGEERDLAPSLHLAVEEMKGQNFY